MKINLLAHPLNQVLVGLFVLAGCSKCTGTILPAATSMLSIIYVLPYKLLLYHGLDNLCDVFVNSVMAKRPPVGVILYIVPPLTLIL